MPALRAQSKAVLVAGALAVTLVVGATSGAVAGRLVTSKDIKDNTVRSRDLRDNAVKNKDIAAGAVSWGRSLDQATRETIEGLVQAGATGPQGEPGGQGPEGPRGPRGLPGGGVVGTETYLPTDWEEVNDGSDVGFGLTDPFSRVDSDVADLIELPGPGTYLISVQVAALLSNPLVFFDDPGASLDLFDDATARRVFSRSCMVLTFGCQASIPFVVPVGSPASVPLDVFAAECSCGLPDKVTVTVFKMDDTPIVLSKVRRPHLRGAQAREWAARLEELRAEWRSPAR